MSGTLSAEIVDDLNVKLTMQFPDGFDHSFMVEQFKGMKPKLDDEGEPVLDGDDNPVMEEDWQPIHTGTRKFVQGEVDVHMCYLPDGHPDWPYARIPGQVTTYRALCYRNAEPDSRVLILHTQGTFTDPVSV